MRDPELQKSIKIGTTCVAAYIATYFMRNMLGVLTPQMLQTGQFTKEWVGALSTAYMLLYAAGQLMNGFLGDRISAKNMIATGLTVTGIASVLFPVIPGFSMQVICFGFFGYGLSMLRGPMVKLIAENTKNRHARVICAFFSSGAFIGAFVAGIFAAAFQWKQAFFVAGVICLFMAVLSYLVIFQMERNGAIKPSTHTAGKYSWKNFFGAFHANRFVFFLIISMIAEITTTSINFWIPTYLTEYLGLSNNAANTVYVVKNILRSVSPLIAIMIYERVKDEMKILKHSFWVSAAIMLLMMWVKTAWINILLFIISLIISGFAAAVLWSIYLPSLKTTGNVSSANGILDCSGYIGAAVSNMIFASMADKIGWNSVVGMWAGIIFFGFVATCVLIIKEKHYR